MKKIVILGSTGSIGINTLKVISKLPKDDFEVVGLSANSNVELLTRQIKAFRPKAVCVCDTSAVKRLRKLANLKGVKLYEGPQGLELLAGFKDADMVVVAVVGNASLLPLIKAIEASKDIALASKEPLVSAGGIVMDKVARKKIRLIPVDSEHSAIFQCLRGRTNGELKKIYLTGSGGPLRKVARSRFDNFSPREVTRHPKWKMGRKISVDSATLMNKGLEVMEAGWLFGVGMDNIEVLIHPEAVVHSMVELKDSTILAQLAQPDMRLPIQYALTFPERKSGNELTIDFRKLNKLTFYMPDKRKFPCLDIAYEAARNGGTYPAVLNAANEMAVDSYLRRRIRFTDIPNVIEKVLQRHRGIQDPGLDDILNADKWAREEVRQFINK